MEQTVNALREMLAANGVLPSERELVQRLNINRHQVRRALSVLRESHELEPARASRGIASLGRGALASDTNPLEVIELRMALEPALARLAAVRASPVEIARIERAAMAADGDPGKNDLAFHKAVAAGARNKLAENVYLVLREIGRDARLRFGETAPVCPVRLTQRNAEHRAVAQAIAARLPDEAERAMRWHLSKVHKVILERLAPQVEAA